MVVPGLSLTVVTIGEMTWSKAALLVGRVETLVSLVVIPLLLLESEASAIESFDLRIVVVVLHRLHHLGVHLFIARVVELVWEATVRVMQFSHDLGRSSNRSVRVALEVESHVFCVDVLVEVAVGRHLARLVDDLLFFLKAFRSLLDDLLGAELLGDTLGLFTFSDRHDCAAKRSRVFVPVLGLLRSLGLALVGDAGSGALLLGELVLLDLGDQLEGLGLGLLSSSPVFGLIVYVVVDGATRGQAHLLSVGRVFETIAGLGNASKGLEAGSELLEVAHVEGFFLPVLVRAVSVRIQVNQVLMGELVLRDAFKEHGGVLAGFPDVGGRLGHVRHQVVLDSVGLSLLLT